MTDGHGDRVARETRIYRAAAAAAEPTHGRVAVLLAPYTYPDPSALGIERGDGPGPGRRTG